MPGNLGLVFQGALAGREILLYPLPLTFRGALTGFRFYFCFRVRQALGVHLRSRTEFVTEAFDKTSFLRNGDALKRFIDSFGNSPSPRSPCKPAGSTWLTGSPET
jgi:hypothetical protein